MSQRDLFDFLRENKTSFFTIDNLVDELGTSRTSIYFCCLKLARQGLVRRSVVRWLSGDCDVTVWQYLDQMEIKKI